MKASILLLPGVAILASLTACMGAAVPLAPVGPAWTSRALSGRDGYLQVFTATQTIQVDFEVYSHPHLGYRIEDASGHIVRFVPNHPSDLVEQPDVVSLPPGTYHVVAESTWCGLVSVPTVVERGRTTVVHLDGSFRGGSSNPNLVHLANGETVGWRFQ